MPREQGNLRERDDSSDENDDAVPIRYPSIPTFSAPPLPVRHPSNILYPSLSFNSPSASVDTASASEGDPLPNVYCDSPFLPPSSINTESASEVEISPVANRQRESLRVRQVNLIRDLCREFDIPVEQLESNEEANLATHSSPPIPPIRVRRSSREQSNSEVERSSRNRSIQDRIARLDERYENRLRSLHEIDRNVNAAQLVSDINPPSDQSSVSNQIEEARRDARDRQREQRAQETSEERDARISARRALRRQTEASETEDQRVARLSQSLRRQEQFRATEPPQARAARLNRDVNRRGLRARCLALNLHQAAFSYTPDFDYPSHPLIVIGEMNSTCRYCSARRFRSESESICCCKGKVRLTPIEQPPEPTLSLYSGDPSHPYSKDFLRNIRKYNNCFQMTSFGVTGSSDAGWSTFRIQGQIYHRIGSLLPQPDAQPKFIQIYFMGDANTQVDLRCDIFQDINRQIVRYFQSMLDEHNALIRLFRTSIDRMPSDEHRIVIRDDRTPAGEHARRFNAPTVDEVAVVMVDGQFTHRDIVLQRRDHSLKRIYETHPSYDALQYPLIFWRGNDSYHFHVKQVNPVTGAITNKNVSAMNYYAHQLMIRSEHQNFVLKCAALLNQFVVDMYAKIETERLLYIRLNQNQLRADDYIHLRDAVAADGDAANVGQRIILPSSYTGSPRHMHEYAQDAMAYVRLYGRPDLFITFTCNPKWPEIESLLFQGQTNSDRHDLTARVFKRKHAKLIEVITKHHLFGRTRCYMSAIEWQKRGLPHSHSLFWFQDRIRPEQIDEIISAELPNPESDPVLFEIVSSHMIHGPCGQLNLRAPCMDDKRQCSCKYPRALIEETQTGENGYPLYRRRKPEDGGHSFVIQRGTNQGLTIDNSWIVPHSPILCRMFSSHINVEYCNSVKSIKYICKYINKGSDMAILEHASLNRNDEITQYQLGRYISSNEAFWRIFSFPIHERYPAVFHLSVHLENGQRVYFRPENAAAIAANPPNTTLTAFFSLCQSDEFARTLLYAEVPRYYTWNQPRKCFNRRKRGTAVVGYNGVFSDEAIGRVYAVHPSHQECFYLRILLNKVRGPTSFEYLKRVDGHLCSSYREACQRRGLLESDLHWENTLTEAAASRSPAHMRHLFAVIICNCSPSNPTALWEKFRHDLSEDFLLRQRRLNPAVEIDFSNELYNQALIAIEDECLRMAGRLISTLGLPAPNRAFADPLNSEILRETNYNVDELDRHVAVNLPLMNRDQQAAFEEITDAIEHSCGGLFFLDSPGGTGKTFLLNLILAYVRQKGDIILAVASSGIAATLLTGGRTAHSAFKLPLNLSSDQPTCSITRGSAKSQLLRRCKAVIWDEVTMSNRKCLEAVDRTLRDLRNDQSLMGGVVFVLAGDFRQTLPVIKRGTPADELNACIKNSYLWNSVINLRLTINMRVRLRADPRSESFSNTLLSIGNGTFPANANSLIKFNHDFCNLTPTVEALIDRVFPNLTLNLLDREWLAERAILAPRNEMVDQLNFEIQERLSSVRSRQYISIDSTLEEQQAIHVPIEYLNSLSPPGFPQHCITLKVGSPIMLLRNLDPPKLCNGTRLSVKNMHNNLIEATVLVGPYSGETVFIPRIPLIYDEDQIEFKRLQFPIRLAFAMTINKSQGQSLKVAGLQLESSCFSHGQLYVACSRVGSPSSLYVLMPEEGTKNIVYQQALR